MVKAAEPEKIPITSPAKLDHEFSLLQTALAQAETEHTWEHIDKAVKRFQAVVRGGAYKFTDEFINKFRVNAISKGIIRSLATERTRLSASTLDLIASCTRLGASFQPLLATYLPAVLRLLCRTNKLYISRATTTLIGIIKHTHLIDVLKHIVVEWKNEGGKSSSFRIAVVESVAVMLGASNAPDEELVVPKEALDRRIDELEWVIKMGATDREPKVRGDVKKCWVVYKREWPERVAAFTAPMTPISRKYLNVAAGGGPLPVSKPITSTKPKVPSALSSSVPASQGPRSAVSSSTAVRSSAAPPIPSFSASTFSRAPPPALSSARVTPVPSSSNHFSRPIPPMPTGPLTSTSAREVRLAKSVGYGPPPSAPSRADVRAVSGPSEFNNHTTRALHGPPSFAQPTASSSSASSSTFRPVSSSTSSASSGPFKPSTTITTSRPTYHKTASATLLNANGEVRKARRVVPLPEPPAPTNVNPLSKSVGGPGRSTTANVPFRPKSAATTPATKLTKLNRPLVEEKKAVAPVAPVAESGMKRMDSAELSRLVAIIGGDGEEVSAEESKIGEVLGGLCGNKVGGDTITLGEVEKKEVADTARVAAAQGGEEHLIPTAQHSVMDTRVTEEVTVEDDSIKNQEKENVDTSIEIVELQPTAEPADAIFEKMEEATTLTDMTSAEDEALNSAGLTALEEAVIVPCIEKPVEPQTHEELEEVIVIAEAQTLTGTMSSTEDHAIERRPGLSHDDRSRGNGSILESESSIDQSLSMFINKLEAEEQDVADTQEPSAIDITLREASVEPEVESVEIGNALVVEEMQDAEIEESPSMTEHGSMIEIMDAEEMEEEPGVSSTFVAELDEDDGPTFENFPSTPLKAQSTTYSSNSPEVFAQTCSIMLDTPPRFEDWNKMAIRLPGADVFEPHDEEEEQDVEEELAPKTGDSNDHSHIQDGLESEQVDLGLEDEGSFSEGFDEEVEATQEEDNFGPEIITDTFEIRDEEEGEQESDRDEQDPLGRTGEDRFADELAPTIISPIHSHDDSDEEVQEEDEEESEDELLLVGKPAIRAGKMEGRGGGEEEDETTPVVFRRSLRSRTVEVEVKQGMITPARTRSRREVLGEVQV